MSSMDNVDKSQTAGSGGAIANATIAGVPRDILLGAMLGISIVVNVLLLFAYKNADTETRMLEYYLLELDAKFIGADLKEPSESIAKKLSERRRKQEDR